MLTSSLDDGGYGLDPDRLWVTVYESDDEAERLWLEIAGLPAERIQRRGMADNFWSMGVPGPCGPCSEIYYDRGPAFGIEGGPVADEDRYLEIWNLVFMQDMRGERHRVGRGGKADFAILGPLPQQNIDTGLGVERLAFLLQGVDNVYETDLLRPIISTVEELSGVKYGADHVSRRAVPGHRRPRRQRHAADRRRRHPRQRGPRLRAPPAAAPHHPLGPPARRHRAVMPTIMAVVRDLMSPSYPELATDFDRIEKVAVDRGERVPAHPRRPVPSCSRSPRPTRPTGRRDRAGSTAFALHDTQGFPIDLTMEMAAEAGLTVDADEFTALMAEQKARARADAKARKGGFADLTEYRRLLDQGATEFTGYSELQTEGTGARAAAGRRRGPGRVEVDGRAGAGPHPAVRGVRRAGLRRRDDRRANGPPRSLDVQKVDRKL